MVAFETLLLGLIIGSHEVRLIVPPEAATVEIRLDGQEELELAGPPWEFVCDFGPNLHPHQLEAVALDREGRELGRARRWVNVPHRESEAQVTLERDPSGALAARLSWGVVTAAAPERVLIMLDGRLLKVEDPAHFPLPALDLGRAHVLSVELQFPGGRVARSDAVFGGDLLERTATELTAVAVEVEPGLALPPVPELQGWFEVAGTPARVVAVESPPVDLAVVPAATPGRKPRLSLLPRPLAPDGGEDRFLFVMPFFPLITRRGDTTHLTCRVYVSPVSGTNLVRQVRHAYTIDVQAGPGRALGVYSIGDAVAVAGTKAAVRNGRRAVVLVVDKGATKDVGTFPAPAVRQFLSDLRVPLEVWAMDAENAFESPWGRAVPITNETELKRALERLLSELGRQRIVWLEGAHLPQWVALTARARGIRIAGAL